MKSVLLIFFALFIYEAYSYESSSEEEMLEPGFKCFAPCREKIFCPPCKCAKGLVLVKDPCGCHCPRCVCPLKKRCNYDLKKMCPDLTPCRKIVEDPCGCKCPICVEFKCPTSLKKILKIK